MAVDDTHAIRRLKHEYCFAIDAGNYEEWAALFTENGRFIRDDGSTYEGADELYEFANELFDAAFDRVAHLVTNPVIDVDGDEATGQWYLFLLFQDSDDNVGWRQAKYNDQYRKVDGAWRIVESEVTYGVRTDD